MLLKFSGGKHGGPPPSAAPAWPGEVGGTRILESSYKSPCTHVSEKGEEATDGDGMGALPVGQMSARGEGKFELLWVIKWERERPAFAASPARRRTTHARCAHDTASLVGRASGERGLDRFLVLCR